MYEIIKLTFKQVNVSYVLVYNRLTLRCNPSASEMTYIVSAGLLNCRTTHSVILVAMKYDVGHNNRKYIYIYINKYR